jgi:hypothetical protein
MTRIIRTLYNNVVKYSKRTVPLCFFTSGKAGTLGLLRRGKAGRFAYLKRQSGTLGLLEEAKRDAWLT